MSSIGKRNSKNYEKIIEWDLPTTFFWSEEGFDGFEFMVKDCSQYQLRLTKELGDFMFYQMYCMKFFEYMKEHHRAELEIILDHMDAEKLKIPQSFIDAFKEDKHD